MLQQLLSSLGLRTLSLRHQTPGYPERMERSLADHARLIQAYEERDAPLAEALTKSLVFRGLAAIEQSEWISTHTASNTDAEAQEDR